MCSIQNALIGLNNGHTWDLPCREARGLPFVLFQYLRFPHTPLLAAPMPCPDVAFNKGGHLFSSLPAVGPQVPGSMYVEVLFQLVFA